MFCKTQRPNVSTKGHGSTPRASARTADAGTGVKKVFGTWDFKWPRGTKIKVAFQRLPADHPDLFGLTDGEREVLLIKLIDDVRRLAGQWVHRDGPRPAIDFEWLSHPDQFWPAPPRYQTSGSARTTNVPYDVLVSFAPLPVAEPDSPEGPGEVQLLPRAQLGAYARREDTGNPTVYLGRPDYLASTPLKAYFDGPQFKHCIVHEFGHVLGLAHEHQNPRLEPRPKWRSAEQIVSLFAAHTGKPKTQEMLDFARTDIIAPWPAAVIGGKVQFSDWRAVPSREDGLYVFDSIMADPLTRSYLDDPAGITPQAAAEAAFGRHAPTAADCAALDAMYPPELPQR